MGRPLKLSERSIRLFKKYVVNNCIEPLHVIVTRFYDTTEFNISESTAKRYMKKLEMYSLLRCKRRSYKRRTRAHELHGPVLTNTERKMSGWK